MHLPFSIVRYAQLFISSPEIDSFAIEKGKKVPGGKLAIKISDLIDSCSLASILRHTFHSCAVALLCVAYSRLQRLLRFVALLEGSFFVAEGGSRRIAWDEGGGEKKGLSPPLTDGGRTDADSGPHFSSRPLLLFFCSRERKEGS